MASLYSALLQRSSHEERDSGILYDRASSDDHVPPDLNGVGETSETSRSSSTTMLMRRAPRSIESWTMPILMLGSYLIAAAVIVAHHIFLHVLDGKSVQDFSIPQTWVRDIGNALARIAQILLEMSVGVALTQSIWFYVRRSTVTMAELNDLFALPSITSISFAALRLSALYVLPIAVSIQAFSLVSIFAPNALSVVPAAPMSSILSAPFPDLSRIAIADSAMTLAAGDSRAYMSPSTGFKTLVQYVFSKGDILPWSTPSGCGLACNYSLVYHAPSLRCSDMAIESSILEETLEGVMDVYKATSTLGYVDTSRYRTTSGSDLYNLSLVHSNITTQIDYVSDQIDIDMDVGVRNGSYCQFVNATYSASVRFANGTQVIDARVLEYAEPYGSLTNDKNVMRTQNPSDFAALGLMDTMTRYLVGSATLLGDVSSNNTQILEGAALFTVQVDNMTMTLNPTGGRNISRTLGDLFTNVTASLMSDTANLGIRMLVPATVLPDKTIYEYQPSRLWLVYGIALFTAMLADLFGLVCMRSNGVAMQRNFSSIAASMRAPELEDLLDGPEGPPRAAAKVAKLRFRVGGGKQGERSGFRIVQGGDEVQMEKVEALNEEKQV